MADSSGRRNRSWPATADALGMSLRGGCGPVAFLVLVAAAAGARVVAADAGEALLVFGGEEVVCVGWRAFLVEQLGHFAHRAVDMVEELFVAGAQVVEPVLAVGSADEPVTGAAAVAGEAHLAVEAVLRQRVEFGPTERDLLLGCDEIDHRGLGDVAEQIVRLHEVIA
jgi:hypothetical protein